MLSKQIKNILASYQSAPVAVRAKLVNMLSFGKLAGTGKLLILPVDQGFEHGPDKSYAANPAAYDPLYHVEIAMEFGFSAYAAPLGSLEIAAAKYPGCIPLILKLNSNNSLADGEPDQAYTSSPQDALRLGACAVGLTIYPGSDNFHLMLERAADVIKKAKSIGLLSVVWSYPRGGQLSKEDNTAIDITAYGAHMAALIGADIIKVKPPTNNFQDPNLSSKIGKNFDTLAARIAHIKQACFNGQRLVIFSGGAVKSDAELLQEVAAINAGGADGSIIGRNAFGRPKAEAKRLIEQVLNIYKPLIV